MSVLLHAPNLWGRKLAVLSLNAAGYRKFNRFFFIVNEPPPRFEEASKICFENKSRKVARAHVQMLARL